MSAAGGARTEGWLRLRQAWLGRVIRVCLEADSMGELRVCTGVRQREAVACHALAQVPCRRATGLVLGRLPRDTGKIRHPLSARGPGGGQICHNFPESPLSAASSKHVGRTLALLHSLFQPQVASSG